MRTKQSMINMAVGIGGQLLTLLITLLNRIVLAHYLSAGYLGVNGLFTNILSLLSMAELGFGSAMIFSMYKPAAEGDEDMLIRLMNLYRKMYEWVAVVVLALGLALYPFLDYLIKDTAGVEHLHAYYLMYLASTVATYVFGYKSSMLLVDQRNYVQLIYSYGVQVVQTVLQIAIIVFTQNYMAYLSVQVIGSILTNILVAWQVDRDYPFLVRHKELPIKETQKSIWKNVYAMSAHKFGTIIVNGTDNLIMSAFVGLTSVGIYSNYMVHRSTQNWR